MHTTPSLAYFWCSSTRWGNSFLHGAHQVAQKSTTTMWPFWALIASASSLELTSTRPTFSGDTGFGVNGGSSFVFAVGGGVLPDSPQPAARAATSDKGSIKRRRAATVPAMGAPPERRERT